MNKKIILAVGLLILLAGGVFAWQYWLVSKEVVKEEVDKELNLTTTKLAITTEDVFHNIVFSPDGHRVAYIESVKEVYDRVMVRVMVNGQEIGRHSRVWSLPVFSPDSQKLAYIAIEPDKNQWFVVVDGKKSNAFDYDWIKKMKEYADYPIKPPLAFSSDSERLLPFGFTVQKEDKLFAFVIVDGLEAEIYNNAVEIVFSPDGRRFAYVVREGGKYFTIIDGQKSQGYDRISDLIFSPNSRHLAYKAKEGDKDFVVFDNQKGKAYYIIDPFSLTFSPDSQRLAYVVREREYKEFIVLDNQEMEVYDGWHKISSLTFSPDSQHLNYILKEGDKYFTIINGKKSLHDYDGVLPSWRWYINPRFIFSPNNQRFAYFVWEEDKSFAVIDGQKGNKYDFVWDINFSFDSQQTAYIAGIMDEQESIMGPSLCFVVINGQEGKRYDWISNLTFSPNSQHLTYIAAEENKYFLVINNQRKERSFDRIHTTPVFSSDGRYVSYGAEINNELWWIVEEVK